MCTRKIIFCLIADIDLGLYGIYHNNLSCDSTFTTSRAIFRGPRSRIAVAAHSAPDSWIEYKGSHRELWSISYSPTHWWNVWLGRLGPLSRAVLTRLRVKLCCLCFLFSHKTHINMWPPQRLKILWDVPQSLNDLVNTWCDDLTLGTDCSSWAESIF